MSKRNTNRSPKRPAQQQPPAPSQPGSAPTPAGGSSLRDRFASSPHAEPRLSAYENQPPDGGQVSAGTPYPDAAPPGPPVPAGAPPLSGPQPVQPPDGMMQGNDWFSAGADDAENQAPAPGFADQQQWSDEAVANQPWQGADPATSPGQPVPWENQAAQQQSPQQQWQPNYPDAQQQPYPQQSAAGTPDISAWSRVQPEQQPPAGYQGQPATQPGTPPPSPWGQDPAAQQAPYPPPTDMQPANPWGQPGPEPEAAASTGQVDQATYPAMNGTTSAPDLDDDADDLNDEGWLQQYQEQPPAAAPAPSPQSQQTAAAPAEPHWQGPQPNPSGPPQWPNQDEADNADDSTEFDVGALDDDASDTGDFDDDLGDDGFDDDGLDDDGLDDDTQDSVSPGNPAVTPSGSTAAGNAPESVASQQDQELDSPLANDTAPGEGSDSASPTTDLEPVAGGDVATESHSDRMRRLLQELESDDDDDDFNFNFDRGGAGGGATPGGQDEFKPYFSSVYEFVRDFLIKVYGRPVRTQNTAWRWCSQWYCHAEAVSRLDALWKAFESLRLDPGTGAAVWWRDFCDPTMMSLSAPDGPFARCSDTTHALPPDLPMENPPEWLLKPPSDKDDEDDAEDSEWW